MSVPSPPSSASHDNATRYFGPAERPSATPSTPTIEGFEILGELGRGGMGIVYKAREVRLDRVVAIKMLPVHDRVDPERLLRFEVEAQAIARISHPNIVEIYSFGTIHEPGDDVPWPYLVMEYIDGGDLTDLEDRDEEAIASLVEKLAEAAEAVHRENILHRDLKPSNILLTSTGEPKLSDFGLARLFDQSGEGEGLTRAGIVLGTPAYMAPEQSAGAGFLGPAVDVYSLGVILYQLLTGRCPFEADSELELLERARSDDPVSPSKLRSGLSIDLETICLKCLEKTPTQRYSTAQGLADDLRRFRNGEPILARPPGPIERLVKWARRRPALATFAVMSLLTLASLVGVVVAVFYQGKLAEKNEELAGSVRVAREQKAIAVGQRESAQRAEQEAERAKQSAERAREAEAKLRVLSERTVYNSHLSLAGRAWHRGNMVRLAQLLDAHRPGESELDQRGFEWFYLKRMLALEDWRAVAPIDKVGLVRFSADGQTFWTGRSDEYPEGVYRGIRTVCDARSGRLLSQTTASIGLAFQRPILSRSQKVLAAAQNGFVYVYDFDSDKLLTAFPGGNESSGVCISDDDKWVAAEDEVNQVIRIHDIAAKKTILVIRDVPYTSSLNFTPDGRTLVGITHRGQVSLYDTKTGEVRRSFEAGHDSTLGRHRQIYAFSRDGKLLAAGRSDGTIRVWDLEGRLRCQLTGFREPVSVLTFSEDGGWLAAGSDDSTIRVWETRRGEALRFFRGHTEGIAHLAFRPDGKRLLSASADGTVRLWDMTRHLEYQSLGRSRLFEFSPDGLALAFHSKRSVYLRSLANKRTRLLYREPEDRLVVGIVFVDSGRAVALVWFDEQGGSGLTTVDRDSGRRLWEVAKPDNDYTEAACSPDGKVLAVATVRGAIELWDSTTGRSLGQLSDPDNFATASLAFSPDGSRIFASEDRLDEHTGRHTFGVVVWDWSKRRVVRRLRSDEAVYAVRVSPDGRTLATSHTRHTVRLWNIESGKVERVCHGHSNEVTSVAFHPEGSRLASGSKDRTVTIWDSRTGQEILSFDDCDSAVVGVRFSADGKWLAHHGNSNSLILRRIERPRTE